MNWYYLMAGAPAEERKGPFPHHDFLAMVQQGKVPQSALAASPELTDGKWLAVKDIPALRKAREARAEKQGPPGEPKAPAPKAASSTPAGSPPSKPSEPPNPFANLDNARPRGDDALPIISVRSRRSSAERPVFDHYWMPSYVRGVWQLTVALAALVFIGAVLLAVLMFGTVPFRVELLVALVFFLLVLSGILVTWVAGVRLLLEMYGIFYDIRSYTKRTAELMEESMAE